MQGRQRDVLSKVIGEGRDKGRVGDVVDSKRTEITPMGITLK